MFFNKVFNKFESSRNDHFCLIHFIKNGEVSLLRNYQPSMFFKTNIGISNNFVKTLKVRIWGSAELGTYSCTCQKVSKRRGGSKVGHATGKSSVMPS